MSVAWTLLRLIFTLTAVVFVAQDAMAQADVQLISQGREVTLEEHLVAGKLVIFDFFADWCAPCRVLTPRLERLVERHPDRIALRKVDVVDWNSPVARQHRVGSLPYLVLYGADGARLAAGDANRVMRVLGDQLDGDGTGVRRVLGRSSVPTLVWITLIAALVVGSLVLRSRGQKRAAPSPRDQSPPTDGAGSSSPRIWFALLSQGLDGPFSIEQLEALSRSGELAAETRVRRSGESSWRRLDEIVPQR